MAELQQQQAYLSLLPTNPELSKSQQIESDLAKLKAYQAMNIIQKQEAYIALLKKDSPTLFTELPDGHSGLDKKGKSSKSKRTIYTESDIKKAIKVKKVKKPSMIGDLRQAIINDLTKKGRFAIADHKSKIPNKQLFFTAVNQLKKQWLLPDLKGKEINYTNTGNNCTGCILI